MDSGYARFQERLLSDFERTDIRPSSQATIEAFFKLPRHCFLHKYRTASEKEWSAFERNSYHFDRVYIDKPLVIGGEGEFAYKSSNSQPSFILALLDYLDVRRGDRVLEIGSGSGWLAAIMGHIVGPTGIVVGIEILDDLADRSRQDLDALGIENVIIVNGDGRFGWNEKAPFQRAIFTAGLYSVSADLFHQIELGGRVVAPIRMLGYGDLIAVLERTETGFRSLKTLDGYFVPLVGQPSRLDIVDVRHDPRWLSLAQRPSSVYRVEWNHPIPNLDFVQKSAGFRAFLTVSLPEAGAFQIADDGKEAQREGFAFGIIDTERGSAGLVTKDGLIGYGAPSAYDRLQECFNQWLALGMPCGADFQLEIEPFSREGRRKARRTWTDHRGDQAFTWKLSAA